jgi:CHAT domain-containing protein
MKRVGAILACCVVSGSVLLSPSAEAQQPGKPTLDDCDARARDHPKELSSYLCYWVAARRLKAWDDAARRLEARLAVEPTNHLAQLYLGLVKADRGDERAGELFEKAADGLAAEKNFTGEVYARISLAYFHQNLGNLPPAREALSLARRAAEASQDPLLLARTDWEQARLAYLTADYGLAWALAAKAESALTPEAPTDLRIGVPGTLGTVCWALGRYRDALGYFEKQAEMYRQAGNLYMESQSRYNIALLAGQLLGSEGMTLREVRDLARQAFDSAAAAGNPWAENAARLLLAEDPDLDAGIRIEHLETVLRTDHEPAQISEALCLLAVLRLQTEPGRPEAALDLAERAIAVARKSGEPLEIALAHVARMNLRWEIGPREAAIADTLSALDAVERVRDLQRDDLVRARWFASQSAYYYQAAGRILDGSGGRPRAEDLDLAFRIAERMRARALLDSLDAARAIASRPAEGSKAAEREATLGRIADAQNRLVQGERSPQETASLLREIDGLETREAVLREEIARDDPRFAALKKPRIPTLGEIQSLLAADEALLAFQLATRRVDETHPRSNGGSWVFVITRSTARAVPLPDADVLQNAIDVYVGLFPRRDGLERQASARLYDDLLKEALSDLPEGVRRLVVIPDRDLHRLPFDALSAGPEEEPLATRFEISIVPSATLWSRSRRSPAGGTPEGVLAFADPALPSGSEPSEHRQGGPWVEGLRLGPLPHAREEARRISRLLGDRCRVLEGSAASEHRLKSESLGSFGVLVLATHAVLDEERPERSAILLAPGAPDEDGLLQSREVVRLPLEGRLVVLSSCSSAAGTLLRGEGVVGLARAFFAAGARSVVASLWPMRDDEAALVAGAFYRELCRGKSVGAAMAAARRERRSAGAPPAEWAGLVVLGDAGLVPFPGGSRPAPLPVRAVLAAAVAVAAAFAFLWRRRRRAPGS